MASATTSSVRAPFPDLKGQAPLRHLSSRGFARQVKSLFLTSKVRLHCDECSHKQLLGHQVLFLTSKVRLHSDPYSTELIPGLETFS